MAYMCDKICGHLSSSACARRPRWNRRCASTREAAGARGKTSALPWRIRLTDARVDYAADPGDCVREHGLARETDAQLVNDEAGKYSRKPR